MGFTCRVVANLFEEQLIRYVFFGVCWIKKLNCSNDFNNESKQYTSKD